MSTNTTIRGAASITDAEFLAAFNDSTKTNEAVLAALSTNWTAIGVKLRSTHLGLHTTGTRSSGAKGTYTAHPAKNLAYEAKLWKEFGVIQPKKPGYSAMTKAEYLQDKARLEGGSAPVAAAVEPAPASISAPVEAAPAAEAVHSQVTETAAAPVEAAPVAAAVEPAAVPVEAAPAETFSFIAKIFGTAYEFSGPDRDAAFDGLFRKLRELNFSKVSISDSVSRQTIGVNDIVNGGNYTFSKQLTAARAALLMPIGTLIVA